MLSCIVDGPGSTSEAFLTSEQARVKRKISRIEKEVVLCLITILKSCYFRVRGIGMMALHSCRDRMSQCAVVAMDNEP